MINMEELKQWFETETGLKVIRISQIGIDVYMVEASDGHTYTVS